MRKTSTPQTLFKALAVIEAIAANQPVEIRRLRKLVNMPAPTLYRFISALDEAGYVTRIAGNGQYQLGFSLVKLGQVALRSFRLTEFVHPLLQEVVAQTTETASLQIRRGDEAICLDCVESESTIRFFTRIGQVRPLYAGAAPKVLLAYLEDEERKKVINGLTLKKIGPNTARNKAELAKRLTAIVKRGYEMTEEEVTEGARAIAVPVFDSSKRVVAALTVLGPKYRMGNKQVLKVLEVLKDSASQIADKLAPEFIALAR